MKHFMEFSRCPICMKGGLLKVSYKKPSEKRIVCANEFYVHVQGKLVDMLMKTERAEAEEQEIVIPANLVLN